ncbi:MAG: flavodoxin family protein [Methanosarcinales archaeon]|nr:flavodoxin family protein [Methanosarcinales archaeon]
MKIVGISGSPNSGGNNSRLIDRSLDIAEERGFTVEKISLAGTSISPCTDCGACREEKYCPFDDDMNRINDILESADGIIVSSPVFFGTLSGQLKTLFDRTLPLRRHGFLLKDKVGAAAAVGGSRNGGQEYTIWSIHAWMHIQGMIVVGDGNHFGGIAQKDVDSDNEGIKTLEDTANKLCDTLERLSS